MSHLAIVRFPFSNGSKRDYCRPMAKIRAYDKHPILESIFTAKFNGDVSKQKEIVILFNDINEAASRINMALPVSYSNFVLDLCRKNRGISKRVPKVVIDAGYDLMKATGVSEDGKNKMVGKFIFVGVGNEINSWITWPEPTKLITVDSSPLHATVRKLLRKDEAAMFSVIDYLDILTLASESSLGPILRLQAPMKWQPNEIDGMYFAEGHNRITFLPVEAKALSTEDEINIDQLSGGFRTVKFQATKANVTEGIHIQSVAALMIENGIRFAFFPEDIEPTVTTKFEFIEVTFSPPLEAWSNIKKI